MTTKYKVAFQGRPGAYSESACYHLFGKDITILPVKFFDDIFDHVESGKADFGMVPIENTTTGSIYENFDNLLKYKIPVVDEVKLRIEHTLMANPGITLDQIKKVRSHPQALGQCSNLFKEYPHLEATPSYDTAGSAELICDGKEQDSAAIASFLAAEKYGLEILKENVENQGHFNQTRFLAISKHTDYSKEVKEYKTSVVFVPHDNHQGVLYESLGVFNANKIDLVKVESRPKPGSPWEYIFYLDFKGTLNDTAIQQAIEGLKEIAHDIHIIGSYPIGETKRLKYY